MEDKYRGKKVPNYFKVHFFSEENYTSRCIYNYYEKECMASNL